MKTLTAIMIILGLGLVSCTSTYNASAPYDEVYGSSRTKTVTTTRSAGVTSQPVTETSEYNGDYYSSDYKSAPVTDSENFDTAGYYDYEYSSRIKRFHDPNPGFDYYDNYYTNVYSYNSDPYAFGSSIYSGYGCYYPYASSFSLGFGWGGYGYGYPYYGYRPWYWDPWYSYSYGWGYGYGGSYWNGYNNGYMDGYYAGGGYYPYYGYNDYNNYNYRNTPRGSRSGNSNGVTSTGETGRGLRDNNDEIIGAAGAARDSRLTGNVPGENSNTSKTGTSTSPVESKTGRAYRTAENAGTADGTLNKSEGNTTTATRSEAKPATAEKQVNSKTEVLNATRSSGNENQAGKSGDATRSAGNTAQKAYNKPAENTQTRSTSANKSSGNETYMSPSRRTQPEMKYEKPKTYTSPTYRTTPSSQEYSSPSSREVKTGNVTEGTARRTYTTTPERSTNTNQPAYKSRGFEQNSSQPSRSVSTPSRSNSYSAPSRSNSYSAPSRSESYSSPSRSSSSPSSGGATRSSGNSGGGSSRGGRK